jgi:hypothetical protein
MTLRCGKGTRQHAQCGLTAYATYVAYAGTQASTSGCFKDEQELGKKCFEDLDKVDWGDQ